MRGALGCPFQSDHFHEQCLQAFAAPSDGAASVQSKVANCFTTRKGSDTSARCELACR